VHILVILNIIKVLVHISDFWEYKKVLNSIFLGLVNEVNELFFY